MATRSVIACITPTGIQAIYCHWDGHIDTNGRCLVDSWNNRDRVEQLMELGDLSALDDNYDLCEAYHRNRGESREDTKARHYTSIDDFLECEFFDSDREYAYIFQPDDFWCVIQSANIAEGMLSVEPLIERYPESDE